MQESPTSTLEERPAHVEALRKVRRAMANDIPKSDIRMEYDPADNRERAWFG